MRAILAARTRKTKNAIHRDVSNPTTATPALLLTARPVNLRIIAVTTRRTKRGTKTAVSSRSLTTGKNKAIALLIFTTPGQINPGVISFFW